MWYWGSNILLDASVRDNNNCFWIWEGVFEDFVKIMYMDILDFFIFAGYWIKSCPVKDNEILLSLSVDH